MALTAASMAEYWWPTSWQLPVLIRPATGSGRTWVIPAVVTHRPPWCWMRALTAVASDSLSVPTAMMLCESWATVEAMAPC